MKGIKKYAIVLMISLGLTIAPTQKSNAFVWAIVKEVLKKVIKAIDLQIQRLQNKTIGLQNAQRQLENVLSKLKLDEIAQWTQKQKELYQKYFDELWKVKTFITYYKRVTEIIEKQKELINEYKQAYSLIQQDKHFTSDELNYIYKVYSGIIDESVKNVDQILVIVESFTVQMSDAARLDIINRCADAIEQEITDLRRFNNQNIKISLQRAKDQSDIDLIRKLYGLTN